MKTKIEVNKLKRIREDNDGKITNVVIHEGFMKIDQSKLGKSKYVDKLSWNPYWLERSGSHEGRGG